MENYAIFDFEGKSEEFILDALEQNDIATHFEIEAKTIKFYLNNRGVSFKYVQKEGKGKTFTIKGNPLAPPPPISQVQPSQDIMANFQKFKDQVFEKLERLNTSLGLTKKDVQSLLGKRFVLLDYLGGSSCDVYSAFDNQTNKMVAVKLAQKEDTYQIRCEQYVLGMLKSCTGVPKVIDFFEDENYIFLVIQPVGTSLNNYDTSPSQLVELAPKLLNIFAPNSLQGYCSSRHKTKQYYYYTRRRTSYYRLWSCCI